MNVTSRPARASTPPKKAPRPPVPKIATRMVLYRESEGMSYRHSCARRRLSVGPDHDAVGGTDEIGIHPLLALTGHSITSSARNSTDCGIVRPRALAVLRLMTSSNLVGCSTGRSAGLAP